MDNIVNNLVKQAGANAIENAVIGNVQQQISGALGGGSSNNNNNSGNNNSGNNNSGNNNNSGTRV